MGKWGGYHTESPTRAARPATTESWPRGKVGDDGRKKKKNVRKEEERGRKGKWSLFRFRYLIRI